MLVIRHMITANSKSYFRSVEQSHRKFTVAVKKAKSRKSIMTLYWRHKHDHETLLKKHLREEMVQINQLKKKIK